MVTRDEFLDIHEAWAKGWTVSQIARETGRDRKTIRRMLQSGGPTARAKRERASKLDPFRDYLVKRVVTDKVTNAAVLFDEIRAKGYDGGHSILWEFVKPLRALVADDERATARFETEPGQQAQVDWGEFKKPERKRVHGFVFTLGWSRAMHLDFADSQALAGFLRCHEHAFENLGGVPMQILYDRTKTVWLRDDDRGKPVFHPALLDFARYYGYEPRLCHAYRPQTKGKVESGVGYVRKNFWPRVVDYERAADLELATTGWLDKTANTRIHGTTGERPCDRLPLEGLRPLAGVPPYRALALERRRVARDCFVSFQGSWYSAPAEYAGREVWVRQTEDQLVISDQDRVLARHPVADKPYQRLVNHEHFSDLKARRDRRLQMQTDEALSNALRLPIPVGPEVEKRSLAVYEALA